MNEDAMFPIIVEAAANFCLHQIRLPYTLASRTPQKRTLIAYIDIETNGSAHRAYIGCDPSLLQTITEIFLGEESSDTETLADMLLETANMIVGSAKVLAEAYQTSMTIATPFIVSDETPMEQPDTIQCIEINNGEMMIALKRL
jgi:hypothetical protein